MSSTPTLRLDHVGVAVQSVAEAEPVLLALGCERTHREVGPGGSFVWATYEFEAGSASRLELVAPVEEGEGGADGPIAAFLASNGPGLHHVTLETDDIDAAVTAVADAGFETVDYAEHEGWTEAFVSPRNPTGALFQLMEYHEGYADERGGPEHAYVGGERLGSATGSGPDSESGVAATDLETEGVGPETVERIAGDPFCARLGIELRSLGPGRATTALDLDEGLTNFHGTPHGGAVYSLADAAFAAASNSHGEPAVALETNVSYLAAADVDGTLVARARETHRTRRTAEYEVVVGEESAGAGDGEEGGRLEGDNERRPESGNGDGEGRGEERRVATFRGRVYRP